MRKTSRSTIKDNQATCPIWLKSIIKTVEYKHNYPGRGMGITVFDELLEWLALAWFAQPFVLFLAATISYYYHNYWI